MLMQLAVMCELSQQSIVKEILFGFECIDLLDAERASSVLLDLAFSVQFFWLVKQANDLLDR